jgi:hypothetical protein
MDLKLPPGQGRAPCLYDEQLQRQQQEKALIEGRAAGLGPPMLFARFDRASRDGEAGAP